jgi:hypothetical protein
MTGQSFSLIPFPVPNIPLINITGRISLQNNILALHYSLAGNIETVFLPPTSVSPSRKDELWKTTCFEFFLAIKDRPEYWEYNMSPSGDWNVYRMDAYRRIGFREERSIQRLQVEAWEEADLFHLNAAVDLNPIFQQDDHVEVGITAVIQTKDGNESYWALAHPAPHPDFHLRESFILAPAEQTHPVPGSLADD